MVSLTVVLRVTYPRVPSVVKVLTFPGKHDTHNGTQNCGHDVAFVADGWEYSRSPVKLDGPCIRLALSHVRDGT